MDTPPNETDAAWTQVEVNLPVAAIERLLADPILVLRLNPLVTYERLERCADGSLAIRANNESNGQLIETSATVTADRSGAALSIAYLNGIKRETRLQARSTPLGSSLRITDVYAPPPGDAIRDLAAVDRSLLPWTAALRRHVERQARWGRVPGYCWLADSFWPSMTPGHRRIAWLLVWTTALEFFVFLGVVTIYAVRTKVAS